ncbi:MAG: aminotransferase class V-fold PLP-dependent enzyme [Clostridia bacterium]|nr:aminotransferase class V-fold PLP-dependent enzyme [Clostridia bacterium]
MIYLDNSATTFPKPWIVQNAVNNSLKYSANPGRSGHKLSIKASEEIFLARKTAAEFFNAKNETDVIFTLNCTMSMNMVIKGMLKSGDHVVVSEMEHNAVMRPLEKMAEKGVTFTQATVFPEDNDKTVDSFRKAINAKTKMIICVHASNVWGIKLPIDRISALAHEYGLLFAVDAAQSAGIVPIDVQRSNIDFLCVAGHKGLYGVMGTGILILSENAIPDTIIEGGTGSNSVSFEQPQELPDRFESGTPNVSGIVGLRAGIQFVRQKKPENIAKHEFMLIQRLYRELAKMKKIRLYMPMPTPQYFVPILSFNIEGYDSETAAAILNKNNIAVRAGLQCSPAAHKMCGTLESGAIRISPSVSTKTSDIDYLVSVLKKL